MEILIYGMPLDHKEITDLIRCHGKMQYRRLSFRYSDNYDGYLAKMKEKVPDLIVVVAKGAAGMEGVYAARAISKTVPVIWFSDDGGFAPHSFRVGVNYFAVYPVNDKTIAMALQKCNI